MDDLMVRDQPFKRVTSKRILSNDRTCHLTKTIKRAYV